MSSQTTWAYESQMDIIAHRMGWDPLEFRLKNLFVSGDHFATGEELHDVHFVECLEASAKSLGTKSENSTRPIGHGFGVMMKSTISTSKSQARLRLADDGSVTLFTSTVEMGQGGHTALAQITAEKLGLPVEMVRVVGPDTDVTPFDSITSASRSTNMMGNAVMAAGAALTKKLVELAAPLLETPPEELRLENGHVVTEETSISFADVLKRNGLDSLVESGEYMTAFKMDPETGQGVSTPHWHQGAGAAEVEVNTETGRVTILRYYAASFAGKVVNPHLAQLQNEGNVVFGLGPAMMEEIVFDGGQPANPNLADYAIPSIRDIPLELISICIESEQGEMHGIGEMTLPPVAPAIANAIEDAVGVRIKDLPITAEKVLRALREKPGL
jgi:CO/xanthine dehydrogenase Mo-binding subunit